eukprot:364439-Chlamydomonas_euryale.AAC.16
MLEPHAWTSTGRARVNLRAPSTRLPSWMARTDLFRSRARAEPPRAAQSVNLLGLHHASTSSGRTRKPAQAMPHTRARACGILHGGGVQVGMFVPVWLALLEHRVVVFGCETYSSSFLRGVSSLSRPRRQALRE